MSGIGVITNPMSRKNRKDPAVARTLAYVLGEKGQFVAPGDLEALARTARRFRDHRIEALCINGGDGTVHQSLTAMVRAYGEDPLPPVAILRGGTMNIIADSVGMRISAEAMLDQVVDAYHSGAELPERRARLLEVRLDDGPPRYGFLSGNGVIAGFLEEYYRKPSPSPIDAATLLARGAVSAVVGGRTVKRLLRPWSGAPVLDGQRWPDQEWVAIAVGTVEQMGLGFRVFHRLAANPDALQVVAIGSSVARLARDLPSLYAGRGVRSPGNRSEVGQRLVLESTGPFGLMVDGDLYRTPGRRVEYRVGPEVRLLLPATPPAGAPAASPT